MPVTYYTKDEIGMLQHQMRFPNKRPRQLILEVLDHYEKELESFIKGSGLRNPRRTNIKNEIKQIRDYVKNEMSKPPDDGEGI